MSDSIPAHRAAATVRKGGSHTIDETTDDTTDAGLPDLAPPIVAEPAARGKPQPPAPSK